MYQWQLKTAWDSPVIFGFVLNLVSFMLLLVHNDVENPMSSSLLVSILLWLE